MKLFKHAIAAFTMAFAATAITSCTDREDDIVSTENSDFSEEQIEKVAYGCGTYADWDETDEKVETTATDEYVAMLKERLATERVASGSTFVSNTQLVGNGNLYFEIFAFAADNPINGYPDLGFDYGVFGMFNYKKDWDENQGKVCYSPKFDNLVMPFLVFRRAALGHAPTLPS